MDTVEAALAASGLVEAAGGWDQAPDAGYRVGHAFARDLQGAGHSVIADSVSPLSITAPRGVRRLRVPRRASTQPN